jgi:hypothetical protein
MSIFLADENLIRGEDHVFETFDGIDDFDIASVLSQSTTQSVPLAASPLRVHRGFPQPFGKLRAGHIRVFLIDHIEIIRGTKQDLRHTIMDGSCSIGHRQGNSDEESAPLAD